MPCEGGTTSSHVTVRINWPTSVLRHPSLTPWKHALEAPLEVLPLLPPPRAYPAEAVSWGFARS